MSPASSSRPARQRPATASRLVRLLAELLDADTQVSHQRFIERLGQSFDLADSIKISAVHDAPMAVPEAPPALDKQPIKAEFERARAAIVRSAGQGFVTDADDTWLRFPAIRPEMTDDEVLSPEPYMGFYLAQQRTIGFSIRELHASTRDAVAELSPTLARLAALDSVLADPLAATVRRAFAAVPRLLRLRFDALLDEYRRGGTEPPHDREHMLGQFRAEMHALLLAEIDTRLLPTLGLIEALDDDDDEYDDN